MDPAACTGCSILDCFVVLACRVEEILLAAYTICTRCVHARASCFAHGHGQKGLVKLSAARGRSDRFGSAGGGEPATANCATVK